MQCSCGQRNWSVTSTRKMVGRIDRTRICLACGSRYQTEERVRTGKRLKRPEADELRSLIDCGEVVPTITTALMTDGSCKRFEPQPASEPTSAKPGSAEKLEVLAARVAAGEHLWHELDDRSPGEPRKRDPQYTPGIREVELLVEVA